MHHRMLREGRGRNRGELTLRFNLRDIDVSVSRSFLNADNSGVLPCLSSVRIRYLLGPLVLVSESPHSYLRRNKNVEELDEECQIIVESLEFFFEIFDK